MKFLLYTLIFVPLTLFAVHKKGESVLDWMWLGNEAELYLKLDLSDGLSFPPIYFIHSDEKLQACEVTIKPDHLTYFETKEKEQLNKIQILAVVENTESPKEIFYRIHIHYTYLLDVDGQRTVQLVVEDVEDHLLNSTIDVTKDPLFYSFKEDPRNAVIVFKNLFHCKD